jgi:hypothetical protein
MPIKQASYLLHLQTRGKGLYEFTGQVSAWLRERCGQRSADHPSRTRLPDHQENADPDVMTDLRTFSASCLKITACTSTLSNPYDMRRTTAPQTEAQLSIRSGTATRPAPGRDHLSEHRRYPPPKFFAAPDRRVARPLSFQARSGS